jgi:hypothetical protein
MHLRHWILGFSCDLGTARLHRAAIPTATWSLSTAILSMTRLFFPAVISALRYRQLATGVNFWPARSTSTSCSGGTTTTDFVGSHFAAKFTAQHSHTRSCSCRALLFSVWRARSSAKAVASSPFSSGPVHVGAGLDILSSPQSYTYRLVEFLVCAQISPATGRQLRISSWAPAAAPAFSDVRR